MKLKSNVVRLKSKIFSIGRLVSIYLLRTCNNPYMRKKQWTFLQYNFQRNTYQKMFCSQEFFYDCDQIYFKKCLWRSSELKCFQRYISNILTLVVEKLKCRLVSRRIPFSAGYVWLAGSRCYYSFIITIFHSFFLIRAWSNHRN